MHPAQIKTEDHGYILRFHFKSDKYNVTYKTHRAVHEILQTDDTFKHICEEQRKKGNNELVIRREKMSRPAITPDFPSCLLDTDELLDIMFIKSDKDQKKTRYRGYSPDDLVCFNIRTKGDGKNIQRLMKNYELGKRVDYVCVWAVKEEKIKVALKRDGRFNKAIFKNGILFDPESDSKTGLSDLVNHLDGKCFRVSVSPHPPGSQESSQELCEESGQKCETPMNIKSEVPETPHQEIKPNGDSTSSQEKKPETSMKETESRKHLDVREIPKSGEILNLLRAQHEELLKILKERENLKNNEVKKFFRVEYDKSVQSFSEVKKVRRLLDLSHAVCQIRFDGSAKGSGFLLFDKYVLTNAHVAGDLFSNSDKLKLSLTAVFGFEDLSCEENRTQFSVKENIVAYSNYKDDHMDFALLELNMDGSDLKVPQLLDHYSAPPSRGAICIIGHPDGAVKRMDPCFIIPKQDIQQEAKEHLKKNSHVNMCHVMTQLCLNENAVENSNIPYNSCFFYGSSGSPVFDESCKLIGVHTGGYAYKDRRKTRSVSEYALPMLPILVHIYTQCKENERADVVEYFEKKNSMGYILQEAKKQLQENPEAMDTN